MRPRPELRRPSACGLASTRPLPSVKIQAPESDVPMQLRAPRLLWLTIATVLLAVVAAGLSFGIPGYRHWRAVQDVTHHAGAFWIICSRANVG